MKTKNFRFLSGRIILPGLTTGILFMVLFFSCKKEDNQIASFKNNMREAANTLDSKVISGTITTESNENEIALNYNNGNKFIVVDKIKNAESFNINSIQSAEIITSEYGVVIKDLTNNKVFLLANNDVKSLKKFETIKSIFANNSQSATIFGVTIVNAEKV